MVEQWLEWARGPVFVAAFGVMVLGLGRQLVHTLLGLFKAYRRANDKSVSWVGLARRTASWLVPFKQIGAETRPVYSVISFVFHVGLIVTPLFLAAHIVLIKRGFGIGWPAIPNIVADVLTILTVVAGLALIAGRIGSRQSRAISRFQDYFLPALLLVPFVTGFLAMHPAINPVNYNLTMLVHVMSANLIFVLMPFTKLVHAVLYPLTQAVSEMGWHFPVDSGRKVGLALGRSDAKV